MKTKLFLLLLVSFIFALSSCDDEYIDPDLVGAWDSNKYYLEIDPDGFGYIEKYGLFGFDGENATIRIKNHRIIFDTNERTKRFDIDEYPFYDEWTDQVIMVLDGREYVLQ